MARGMNLVVLIGNVGQDPEIRRTEGRQEIATFNVATTERWNDEDHTEWHRIVAFGKVADVIDRYLRKGDKVSIRGKLRYRRWEDREGQTRYTTEVVVDDLFLLGSPAGGRREDPVGNGGEEYPDYPGDEGGLGEAAEPEPAPARPRSTPRGGAEERDVPAKQRPSGLPARGSKPRGPVRSAKKGARR